MIKKNPEETRFCKAGFFLVLLAVVLLAGGCKNKTVSEPSGVIEESEQSLPPAVELAMKQAAEAVSEPSKGSKGDKVVVKTGDTIDVDYTGKLADGTVFDTSIGRQPLTFKVGEGKLLPDFEAAVLGMAVKEKKTFNVKAARAYGERNENNIQKLPRTFLPADFKGTKGTSIAVQDQSGNRVPAVIVDLNEKEVTLDVNHPLAGKDLIFEIQIAAINPVSGN